MLTSLIIGASLLTVPPAIQSQEQEVVSLAVKAEPRYTIAHQIVIYQDLNGRNAIRAIRTSDQGTQRLSSAECPGLQKLVDDFRALPPLRPAALPQRTADGSFPILPTMKDGFDIRLTFQSDDGGQVETHRDGAYGQWAQTAVGALLRCWEPLWPTPRR